mgnify:CR=1 FL=1
MRTYELAQKYYQREIFHTLFSYMPSKPNMSVELALLLALATLWGASYTFIKLGADANPAVSTSMAAWRNRLGFTILTL